MITVVCVCVCVLGLYRRVERSQRRCIRGVEMDQQRVENEEEDK